MKSYMVSVDDFNGKENKIANWAWSFTHYPLLPHTANAPIAHQCWLYRMSIATLAIHVRLGFYHYPLLPHIPNTPIDHQCWLYRMNIAALAIHARLGFYNQSHIIKEETENYKRKLCGSHLQIILKFSENGNYIRAWYEFFFFLYKSSRVESRV